MGLREVDSSIYSQRQIFGADPWNLDAPPQPSIHADPDEVDISEHYYAPPTTSRIPNNASPQTPQGINEDALRQMMLGFDPAAAGSPSPGANPFANPFAGFPGMGGPPGMEGTPGAEDPMMKMLQQMMGGVPGEGPGGVPTFPGMPGQAVAAAGDPYAYLWRIVHALFALSLGLYIAFTTTFTGTKLERDRSGFNYNIAGEETGLSASSIHFFWIFATAEVVLQTSRFMVEKGKAQHAGMLGTVIGFLPQPWKGYVELAARYSRIWTTVTGDAFACVFVLGVCVWLRGGNVV